MKIRVLTPPSALLDGFDPGAYLSSLEFYEADGSLTEQDRDALAQFTHLLGFMALKAKSSKWLASTVRRGSGAYQALQSHFSHLEGWRELADEARDLHYRQLASFLMRHYPPHRLEGHDPDSGDETRPDFQIGSYVSTAKAWHQDVTFDRPCRVKVSIENLGGGPIYGFYVNEEDFQPVRQGQLTSDILDRISKQTLCENESGRAQVGVLFPPGRSYICIELDCQAAPTAERAEFRISLQRSK